ncbi:MAG: thioesterase family protein [Bacteroidales bacterium]|nr:thioesterase family protein [Bacteroidales bacterium]
MENFNHKLPIQIRFNDIDSLGHVNNAVYLTYFDLGKADYFQTIKKEIIDWTQIDIVVANVNIDFFSPTYMNEKLEVHTKVTIIGNKSVKLLQHLINTETNEMKSICYTVMVGYHPQLKQSKVISDEWRLAIDNYEGR